MIEGVTRTLSNPMAPSSLFFTIILALFFSTLTLTLTHDIKHRETAIENRIKSIQFSLYGHEQFNKTAYFVVKGVAGPIGITKTSSPFGSLIAYRDPLTETPDPTSRILGYAEGMAITASFTGDRTTCFSMITLNLKGYKGELINIGTAYYNQVSELAFVGGTGDFRFAQGYITTSVVDLSGPATCYKVDFVVYWPPYAHKL